MILLLLLIWNSGLASSLPRGSLVAGLGHIRVPVPPKWTTATSITSTGNKTGRRRKAISSSTFEARALPLQLGQYFVALVVGTPGAPLLGVVDTGSGLVHVACAGCTVPGCISVRQRLDPALSSSARAVNCPSDECQLICSVSQSTDGEKDTVQLCGDPEACSASSCSCGSNGECNFNIMYGDNSFAQGSLLSDVFTLAILEDNPSHLATTPQSSSQDDPRGNVGVSSNGAYRFSFSPNSSLGSSSSSVGQPSTDQEVVEDSTLTLDETSADTAPPRVVFGCDSAVSPQMYHPLTPMYVGLNFQPGSLVSQLVASGVVSEPVIGLCLGDGSAQLVNNAINSGAGRTAGQQPNDPTGRRSNSRKLAAAARSTDTNRQAAATTSPTTASISSTTVTAAISTNATLFSRQTPQQQGTAGRHLGSRSSSRKLAVDIPDRRVHHLMDQGVGDDKLTELPPLGLHAKADMAVAYLAQQMTAVHDASADWGFKQGPFDVAQWTDAKGWESVVDANTDGFLLYIPAGKSTIGEVDGAAGHLLRGNRSGETDSGREQKERNAVGGVHGGRQAGDAEGAQDRGWKGTGAGGGDQRVEETAGSRMAENRGWKVGSAVARAARGIWDGANSVVRKIEGGREAEIITGATGVGHLDPAASGTSGMSSVVTGAGEEAAAAAAAAGQQRGKVAKEAEWEPKERGQTTVVNGGGQQSSGVAPGDNALRKSRQSKRMRQPHRTPRWMKGKGKARALSNDPADDHPSDDSNLHQPQQVTSTLRRLHDSVGAPTDSMSDQPQQTASDPRRLQDGVRAPADSIMAQQTNFSPGLALAGNSALVGAAAAAAAAQASATYTGTGAGGQDGTGGQQPAAQAGGASSRGASQTTPGLLVLGPATPTGGVDFQGVAQLVRASEWPRGTADISFPGMWLHLVELRLGSSGLDYAKGKPPMAMVLDSGTTPAVLPWAIWGGLEGDLVRALEAVSIAADVLVDVARSYIRIQTERDLETTELDALFPTIWFGYLGASNTTCLQPPGVATGAHYGAGSAQDCPAKGGQQSPTQGGEQSAAGTDTAFAAGAAIAAGLSSGAPSEVHDATYTWEVLEANDTRLNGTPASNADWGGTSTRGCGVAVVRVPLMPSRYLLQNTPGFKRDWIAFLGGMPGGPSSLQRQRHSSQLKDSFLGTPGTGAGTAQGVSRATASGSSTSGNGSGRSSGNGSGGYFGVLGNAGMNGLWAQADARCGGVMLGLVSSCSDLTFD